MTWHVAGIDLSLSSSGVAVLRGDPPAPTATRTPMLLRNVPSSPASKTPTLLVRRDRHARAAARIIDTALTGWDPEHDDPPLFVIEAPLYRTPMKRNPKTGQLEPLAGGGHAHDRAWLWGLVVHILFKSGVVVEVSTTTLKRYATGKGSGRKAGVLASMPYMFPGHFIDDDNLADAAVLAAMGARQLGHPVEPSSHRVSIAALEAVAWPRWPKAPTE